MENLIVIGILLVLVGAAVLYIWKEKKKGTRCIGCPAYQSLVLSFQCFLIRIYF